MPLDPRIIAALGGIGALNPSGGGGGFLAGWQRAQQEHQQQLARQQQQAGQQEQLGFQRNADVRAGNADIRAQQDQQMQLVNGIRSLLGDQAIMTPEDYSGREAMLLNLAQQPNSGIDTGFVQSLRKTYAMPTVFQQRRAKQKLSEIESDPQIKKLIETGQDLTAVAFTVPELGANPSHQGQPVWSLDELKQLAQLPTAATPLPSAVKQDVPNTSEEYMLQAFAAEHGYPTFAKMPFQLQSEARQKATATARQPADTELQDINKNIARMRLEALQRPGGNVSVSSAPIDTMRPTGPKANVADPVTGLTPNALFQAGMDWAMTGRTISQGLGGSPRAQAVRAAIPNMGSALAAAAAVDIPTLRADYRANSDTLKKLLPQAVATANASNTATDNLDLALTQSGQVTRSGAKLANRYGQWIQGNLTPAKGLSQFETYIYTAVREYAKVTSGGAASVQALTDSATREAERLLNAAQAPEVFAGVVEAMKNDMANVVGEQAKGLGRVSTTIANFFSAVNGFDQPRITAPGTTPPSISTGAAPKEGDAKPIEGYPGTEQTYRGGKWIRTK